MYDTPPEAAAAGAAAAAAAQHQKQRGGSDGSGQDSFWPALRVQAGEQIYDFAWFRWVLGVGWGGRWFSPLARVGGGWLRGRWEHYVQ